MTINQEREAFARKDRYIVIKLSDLAKIPAKVGIPFSEQLTAIQRRFPKRECLVIESDWPEYPIAWSMIEARVTGDQQPAGVAVPAIEVRKVVTDAMVSMVAVVTGLVPPSGPGAIPDFVQAPIDRAVTQITGMLAVAPHPVSGGQKPDALRKRFSDIEDEIMAGKHNAASVFTAMRTAALYIGKPAAQDVAGLVEALEYCEKWFMKHSPTAPLIGDLGNAEHPMLRTIRNALAAHRTKQGEQQS